MAFRVWCYPIAIVLWLLQYCVKHYGLKVSIPYVFHTYFSLLQNFPCPYKAGNLWATKTSSKTGHFQPIYLPVPELPFKPVTSPWNHSCWNQPQADWLNLRLETVVWQSAGGVSLILPDMWFGSVFQYWVTYNIILANYYKYCTNQLFCFPCCQSL